MNLQPPSTLLRMLLAQPNGKRFLPALTITGVVIMAISVVFNRFGLLHFEWWGYIPFHLGPGSIWAKIFDNRTLDQGVYTGRELSYLIDHLDMLAVALSIKWGMPMFISITHLVLCVFIGVWTAWFVAHDLRLGSLCGLLLAVLFWTTPFVYIHFLMRTAKVLAAAATVVLIIEIFRAYRMSLGDKRRQLPLRYGISITLAAWVMSFSDRQGFYFLLLGCAFMVIEWLLDRARSTRTIILLLFAVVALELVYFFWIAPALTKLFWGYTTDFSFNRLPLGQLWESPRLFIHESTNLLIQTISFTLGMAPHLMVVLIFVATVAMALGGDIQGKHWRGHVPLSFVLTASMGALWVMYLLMIVRHPPLMWPDVEVAYYWIPTAAVVILGIACGMADWLRAQRWRIPVFVFAMLVLVAGNIVALPRHMAVFSRGHLATSIAQTGELRYALMHRGDPTYVVPRKIEDIPAYPTLIALAPQSKFPQAPWGQMVFGEYYRRTSGPGAPPQFIDQFGGNVDSRFLHTNAGFLSLTNGSHYMGGAGPHLELLVNLPSNRMQGKVVLQRLAGAEDSSLSAVFTIYAQAHSGARFERWTRQVILPPGQRELEIEYAIDSSHMPTFFSADIPAESIGKLAVGWSNPYVTDIGSDSNQPRWFNASGAPVVVLHENALGKVLPSAWRPVEALMRNGRVTKDGVELFPGGEIWIKVDGIVSRFVGLATNMDDHPGWPPAVVRGLWYKAGRLQTYQAPKAADRSRESEPFQAWCGESGGWLVIAADPFPFRSGVAVRVTEVKQE